MTNPPSPSVASPPGHRPVLFWRPDSAESHVQADIAQAAAFLGVSAEAVTAAIDSGDLMGGWFVDWEVVPAA